MEETLINEDKHKIITEENDDRAEDAFDKALEEGIKAGVFDDLAEKALKEFEAGKTTPI